MTDDKSLLFSAAQTYRHAERSLATAKDLLRSRVLNIVSADPKFANSPRRYCEVTDFKIYWYEKTDTIDLVADLDGGMDQYAITLPAESLYESPDRLKEILDALHEAARKRREDAAEELRQMQEDAERAQYERLKAKFERK